MQLLANACLTGMRMAAPLHALRLGHGEVAVGTLLALFSVSQVFLALPAGRYCERHGLKRPVVFGILGIVAGGAIAAIWPVLPTLCIGAVLTGGGNGIVSIAVQRQVGRIAGAAAALRTSFSWLATGLALSNVLGPVVAGVMLDVWGIRAAFAATAALPLLACMLLPGATDLVAGAARAPQVPGDAWDLWRNPDLRRLLCITCVLAACWDVHIFLVPVLGNERGLPASVIGTIVGAFGAAAAAVRLLTPLVAARLREWAILFTAMLGTAIVFALYPLMPAALAMGACSVLLGFTMGSTQPMVMSLLNQLTPQHRFGEAVAMRVMVNNVSSVGVPMLCGLAGSVLGAMGVFWGAGLVVGAASRLALKLGTP